MNKYLILNVVCLGIISCAQVNTPELSSIPERAEKQMSETPLWKSNALAQDREETLRRREKLLNKNQEGQSE